MPKILFFIFVFLSNLYWNTANANTLPETPHEIQALLNEFHDVMDEGGDEQSLRETFKKLITVEGLKDWVAKYNFKRLGLNAYRLYNIKIADTRFRAHVANLAFIFPASHLIETLFGPIMSTVSMSLDWPGSVTTGFGTVGAIISVPGLDPICILIYTTYPYPKVRNTITFLREKTMSLIGFAGNSLGLNVLAQKIKNHFGDWTTRIPDSAFFDDQGLQTPLFQIMWSASNNKFISAILISAEGLQLPRNELKSHTSFLPTNVRFAIDEALAYYDGSGTKPFYLDSIEKASNGDLYINWKDRSVVAIYTFFTCQNIF